LELNQLNFKRIRISEKSTFKCRNFKIRTGLTPNIASRIGLALSLSEKTLPPLELFYDETGQEINRQTFLGENELFFLGIFTVWCNNKKIKREDSYKYLIAHINRGIEILVNRVKSLEEIVNILDA